MIRYSVLKYPSDLLSIFNIWMAACKTKLSQKFNKYYLKVLIFHEYDFFLYCCNLYLIVFFARVYVNFMAVPDRARTDW